MIGDTRGGPTIICFGQQLGHNFWSGDAGHIKPESEKNHKTQLEPEWSTFWSWERGIERWKERSLKVKTLTSSWFSLIKQFILVVAWGFCDWIWRFLFFFLFFFFHKFVAYVFDKIPLRSLFLFDSGFFRLGIVWMYLQSRLVSNTVVELIDILPNTCAWDAFGIGAHM